MQLWVAVAMQAPDVDTRPCDIFGTLGVSAQLWCLWHIVHTRQDMGLIKLGQHIHVD